MDEPVEELYFNWLYSKVAWHDVRTPSTTYHSLLYLLHSTEFTWLISGDDNRAKEGKELRNDFFRESRTIRPDGDWLFLECSVLELLIGFAKRAEFQTEQKDARDWFWTMLENLGLADMNDGAWRDRSHLASIYLDTFIWRTYDELGRGGLFPLRQTARDQRKIEIWYQFCEYLIDQNIS